MQLRRLRGTPFNPVNYLKNLWWVFFRNSSDTEYATEYNDQERIYHNLPFLILVQWLSPLIVVLGLMQGRLTISYDPLESFLPESSILSLIMIILIVIIWIFHSLAFIMIMSKNTEFGSDIFNLVGSFIFWTLLFYSLQTDEILLLVMTVPVIIGHAIIAGLEFEKAEQEKEEKHQDNPRGTFNMAFFAFVLVLAIRNAIDAGTTGQTGNTIDGLALGFFFIATVFVLLILWAITSFALSTNTDYLLSKLVRPLILLVLLVSYGGTVYLTFIV